tara:strand:- start:98 stop:427 length:330 start_codon:yes stop_codon:yes gene_type:complete
MHKVVTAREQTLETDLENPKRKNSGKIKITGKEKKDGWGQFSASFDVACNSKVSDPLFFTISKQDGAKFKPVYKSECRKNSQNDGLNYTTIHSDTDTLANSEPEKQIKF